MLGEQTGHSVIDGSHRTLQSDCILMCKHAHGLMQGLSHRQVLQQGIVQLQQQLASERDAMVGQRMQAARRMLSGPIRCR